MPRIAELLEAMLACCDPDSMMSLPVDRNGKPAVLVNRRRVWEVHMAVQLNHTIVWCRDKERSAAFLAEMLGRPAPTRFGPFQVVELDNGVSLDFHDSDDEVASQHYAFLIGDDDFDAVLARVRAGNRTFWPDPGKSRPNEINRNDGGRGFYFDDPDGHLLEVITRPYGGA